MKQLSALTRVAFAWALMAATPAGADERPLRPEEPIERAEDILRQATEALLQTLHGIVAAIPQYEAPVIDENGDIIIRRKRPPDVQPPPDPDEVIRL